MLNMKTYLFILDQAIYFQYCKTTAIDCPLQIRLENETNKEEGKIYNEQYKELFKFLENATGIKNFAFEDVNPIYNIQVINHLRAYLLLIRKSWIIYAMRMN